MRPASARRLLMLGRDVQRHGPQMAAEAAYICIQALEGSPVQNKGSAAQQQVAFSASDQLMPGCLVSLPSILKAFSVCRSHAWRELMSIVRLNKYCTPPRTGDELIHMYDKVL